MLVDIILIAVIGLAVFLGWKRGLVLSVFLLGSTILAIFLASILSPVVSMGLDKMGVAKAMTPGFSSIVEESLTEEYEKSKEIDIETATEKLPLPSFLSEEISTKVDDTAEESISKISNKIGSQAAGVVCSIIAFVIVFIIVMIAMQIIKAALKIVVKLPFLNRVDKIGGIIVGFIEGVLFVLVFLLFVSALSPVGFMQSAVRAIENSTITRFLYESNFVGKIISLIM